jgi:hypothetical protein
MTPQPSPHRGGGTPAGCHLVCGCAIEQLQGLERQLVRLALRCDLLPLQQSDCATPLRPQGESHAPKCSSVTDANELACKEGCFDCLLRQLLKYLAGSQHVSRLHVQRPCLLRRQLQLGRPGIHPRADHGNQMMRNPRCHAVPANAVACWSIKDVGRRTSRSWQLCSVAWQPMKRGCPCPVLGTSVGPACSCTSSS